MRGSRSGDLGEVGEQAAKLAFQKIGWPATQTSKRELGTDLWIEARERRFDRGVLLGAQVKSGASSFAHAERGTDGSTSGWWFRCDRLHFDYWLGHSLPHLIVLYDPETGACYWEHLTPPKIERTSKTGKILVPARQTISPDNLGALFTVAATARPDVPLEGTAWTGSAPVATADHFRFALVTPRLLAPHPNRGAIPQTPAEAVGLIAQGRIDHVWRYACADRDVPTRVGARTHPEWGWRFAAALADWLTSEDFTGLEARVDDAAAVEDRVAATIAVAHAHMANAAPKPALKVVDAEIERDQAAPVDHAWLHLHRARGLFDSGEIDGARAAAEVALPISQKVPDDLTASAITGTATAVLFNTAPFGAQDVGVVIESNDTAVNWWRAQSALPGGGGIDRDGLSSCPRWKRCCL